MTTLLFTHHGVSVSIQHKCHAVFCTPDYDLGRVKDLLHPVPSCIIETSTASCLPGVAQWSYIECRPIEHYIADDTAHG